MPTTYSRVAIERDQLLFEELLGFGAEMPNGRALPVAARCLGPFRWNARTARVAMPVYAPFDLDRDPRPHIIDILEYPIEQPRQFALWDGHAQFLGLDDLSQAKFTRERLLIAGNPVQWIAAKASRRLAVLFVGRNKPQWWSWLDALADVAFGDRAIEREVRSSLAARPRPKLSLVRWAAV